MKKKWTVIDTLIVVAVIVAGVVLFKVFGGSVDTGEKTLIEAKVMIASQSPEVGDAIKVGDTVVVSLTEKDSGIVKALDIKTTERMVYNSIEGVYKNTIDDETVDIYAVVELETTETDLAYSTGSTVIKVGDKMPFRGKGYALEGYVIEINEVADHE